MWSPLCPERRRKITGSFACIAPRCIRDGFWSRRSQPALLLSGFLVLVADRNGLSSDSFDTRCALVQLPLDADLLARHALSKQDLLAFDGHLLQGLSLPRIPVPQPARPLPSAPPMAQADPATSRHIIRHSLGADHD